MKKAFKATALLLALLAAFAFVGCSNSSDSGGGDGPKTIFSGTTWKCVNSGGEVDMLYKFAASDNKVTRTYNSTGITETTAYIFVAPRTAKIAKGTIGGEEDFVIDENDPNKATAGNGLTQFVKQ